MSEVLNLIAMTTASPAATCRLALSVALEVGSSEAALVVATRPT